MCVYVCICGCVCAYVCLCGHVHRNIVKKTFRLVVQAVLHKKDADGGFLSASSYYGYIGPREAQAIRRPVKLVFIGSILQTRCPLNEVRKV